MGTRSTLWRHALALLVTALFVAPLVLMVSGSLREAGLPPPRVPELVPSPLAFENYSRAFELVDIPRYALNSVVIAAIAVPLSVGAKPGGERRCRPVEDRSRSRIDVMPAVLAGVRAPAHDPVVLRDTGAGIAVDAVRKPAREDPLEARVVVRLKSVDLDEQRSEIVLVPPHRGKVTGLHLVAEPSESALDGTPAVVRYFFPREEWRWHL